jgi:hypothetical protein
MGRKVEIIEANKGRINRINSQSIERLRVAAYCRVSTDSDEQLESYQSQLKYYRDLIKSNENWEYVGVVDRFEGKYAVLEDDDGRILNIKKHLLPKDIQEGDVIDLDTMTVVKNETEKRKNIIEKLADELFKDEDINF